MSEQEIQDCIIALAQRSNHLHQLADERWKLNNTYAADCYRRAANRFLATAKKLQEEGR